MSDIQPQEDQSPLPEPAPPVPEVAPEPEVADETGETETQDGPVADTHESLLTELLSGLEGIAHMGKTEVQAFVAAVRSRFETL